MKNWIKTMLMLSVLCLAACSSDPDVESLRRDTDAVQLAYNTNATSKISVRYNGPWEARVAYTDQTAGQVSRADAEQWLTLSPASGVGNGSDYQWVTVTAQRNSAAKRTAWVYLKGAGRNEVKIEVSQDDGFFKIPAPMNPNAPAAPAISGTIKAGFESEGTLDLKYDKAFGGEQIQILSELSGEGAVGLSIADTYDALIEREGSGMISIPITGLPEVSGELICKTKVLLDGEVIFDGQVKTSVISPVVVFNMDFELFKWGGNYPANKSGVGPDASIPRLELTGNEETPATITTGTDGAGDMFNPNSMSDVYRTNRGITGWTGQRVYEHPGYVKLGVTGQSGWIMSPALAGLTTTPETVIVSIDFMRFDKEDKTYIVSAEGAGAVMNGEVNSSVLPAQDNAAGRKWTTLNFTVKGATSATKIKLSGADLASGKGARLNIDNFMVMGTYKPVLKDPLPAPEAEKIAYIPTVKTIDVYWPEVTNATGYLITLAEESQPDFAKTVECLPTELNYKFEGLNGGFYIFTVQALYKTNPEFNSAKTSVVVGTKGYLRKKLSTPVNIEEAGVKPNSVSAVWDFVSGAGAYKVSISKGGAVIETKQVDAPACTFKNNITRGETYVVAIQALGGDVDTQFDSDVASINVVTPDPKPLTSPTVKLYAKTHGYAAIEWTLSAAALAEQPLSGNADTYDFRLKDAQGNVSEVWNVSEFNAFAFNRYKFFRFAFGGLTSGAFYTMEMRRKSTANTELYLDSEWVSVAFTLDAAPDKSGYLLYVDFENHPYGAEPILCAYGCAIGSGFTDFSNGVKLAMSGSKNTVYNPTSPWGTASYAATYAPMWDAAELTNTTYNSNVNLAMGVMKFGGGSKPAWLTLPKLSSLASATDVVLELSACPYYEPSSTGSMQENCAAEEHIKFFVEVTGATITEADGVAVNGTVAELTNVKASQMGGAGGAEALKRYIYTDHNLRISGATGQTRIKVYTQLENDGKQHRMWLDNIKVRKAR